MMSKVNKSFEYLGRSPLDNARMDFQNHPEKLKLLEDTMKEKYPPHQLNWCQNSGECSCIGCVNYEFANIGLSEHHWQVWVDEIRKPHIADSDTEDPIFGITIYAIGENRTAVSKFLKEEIKIAIPVLAEIFKGKNHTVIEKLEYSQCVPIKERLKELGCVVKIFKDEKAPRHWRKFF